jgi:methylenetetrahydrofolate dehydrogenase (NADP+)/methenyltetrahydrofolate cyclohydrolase
MIKENSVLLDVGINEIEAQDGSTIYTGDINYNDCINKALAITPVPGGIGRVTTAVLYLNLVAACLNHRGLNKTIDEYITLIFNANQ